MQAPEVLGGRYELRGVLGRGGMAEVRDGWDIRLDRPVAVKLLHPMLIEAPDNRLRFQTEARAAAALNHPHIVSVHDSGEHAGTPYIVMERLSGQTLADVIARGPLPQPQVRAIIDDVLSALSVAHAAGILHRDIKPANILFSRSGHAKVADFGVAKSPGSVHTMTGQIVGTMAYLSPERIAGRPASVADDLYAVGVVGYEALTGRRAFPQENIAELARAISQGALPPLGALRPDADPALAAVIDRAMALDPAWRFATAEEMRAALAGRGGPPARPATRVMAVPLPDPTTMVAPPVPRPNRSRWWLITAAVVAALVIAIAFIVDSSSRPAVPEPASTSTSVPPPPPTSFVPPPPTTTPVQAEEPPPKKGPPGHGNGKGPKPKHRG
jgi:serine/threonine protein kinase